MPLYHMFPLLYSVTSTAAVTGRMIAQLDSAGPSPIKAEFSDNPTPPKDKSTGLQSVEEEHSSIGCEKMYVVWKN